MIIFDVGASDGVFSRKYTKNSVIYAFEPNHTNLKKLRNNCGNIRNYNIIDKAVSDIEGTINFYESNYTNSSSLLPFTDSVKRWKNPTPTLPQLSTVNTYLVKSIRLDSFIKEYNISQIIDFIKIDTQGHDLNVIKSLGDNIFNVREILCEVQIVNYELYKGQANKKDLLEYLESKNFSIRKVQPWSHNQEENIWFTNNRFTQHYNLE